MSVGQTLMSPRNGFLYLCTLNTTWHLSKLGTGKGVHIFASLRMMKNLLYVKSFLPKLFKTLGSICIFSGLFWLHF